MLAYDEGRLAQPINQGKAMKETTTYRSTAILQINTGCLFGEAFNRNNNTP